MGKLVRALGFSRISARPQHPRSDPASASRVQKKLPELIAAAVGEKALGKRIEIWFQDEARIGQKGELTRQWARRGSRPRQPRDQRYQAAYLFAAACPEAEKTAALVLPQVNTEAMNLHLAEIARHVAADAHAVVILDQAGWHGGNALIVPENLTLLPLPPYSPELNPIENLWQFLTPQLPQRPRLRRLPSGRRCLLRRLEPSPRHPRSDPIHHHQGLGQNGHELGRLVSGVRNPSPAERRAWRSPGRPGFGTGCPMAT